MYQLAKFGDLKSCGSQDIFKNAPCPMYSSWRHRFGIDAGGTFHQLNVLEHDSHSLQPALHFTKMISRCNTKTLSHLFPHLWAALLNYYQKIYLYPNVHSGLRYGILRYLQ